MAFDWSITPFCFKLVFKSLPRTVAECNREPVRLDCPDPRSGHRCVTDGISLYCYGGFNPNMCGVHNVFMNQGGVEDGMETCYPLFRELWKFNISSRQWSLLPTATDFPVCLASPHVVLVGGKYLVVYGGTGFEFGINKDDTVRSCDLSTGRWRILPLTGDQLPAIYGHGMTCISTDIYTYGGTTGNVFENTLFKIDLKNSKVTKLEDTCYIKLTNLSLHGRYRHEIIYYDNKLYVFGGGFILSHTQLPHINYTFDQIVTYDLISKTWKNTKAIGDMICEEEKFPDSRKCHSCVLYKSYIYVCGGFTGYKAFSDLWRFDLTSNKWTKLNAHLPKGLYFHSASVTEAGCMLIYGGVEADVNSDIQGAQSDRTSDVYEIWLDVPSLRDIAWRCVSSHLVCNTQSYQSHTLLELGIPDDLINHIQAA